MMIEYKTSISIVFNLVSSLAVRFTVKSKKSLPGTGVWSWRTSPAKEMGDPAGPKWHLELNILKVV
jgi:hypothetical protein